MRNTDLQAFGAPNRYVQGRDATYELAAELLALGIEGPVGIITGKTAQKALSSVWEKTFKEANISYTLAYFQGESSRNEANRLATFFQKEKIVAIIGSGGGKTLDTTRIVAEMLKLPVILCPSTASNDSPCFSSSHIYSEDGEYEETVYMKKNPLLVLVDTTMIADGSARHLACGMAEAVAAYVEGLTCKASSAKNLLGANRCMIGEFISKGCFETIINYGRLALDAVKCKSITSALEKVVEANILLSGMAAESYGTAAAHAIHHGLTTLDETRNYFHGEKIAFGVCVQIMLEGASKELVDQILTFFVDVDLPVTLKDLGIENPSEQMLLKIAKKENKKNGLFLNEPFNVSDRMIVDAIRAADMLGRRYKEEFEHKSRKTA